MGRIRRRVCICHGKNSLNPFGKIGENGKNSLNPFGKIGENVDMTYMYWYSIKTPLKPSEKNIRRK